MPRGTPSKRWGLLAVGILIGLLFSALMPAQPLHAVATHGQDGYILATGLLDSNIEGVYFLDCLTGTLKGAALNVANGTFTTQFERNLVQDLKIDPAKTPKFLMVTGNAGLRHGPTQVQPGLAVIYVAEINSGILAAYGVQWNIGRSTMPSPQAVQNSFVLLSTMPLRNYTLRQQ
jgi:hypothetical protein